MYRSIEQEKVNEMAKFKNGDVIYDTKQNTHFALIADVKAFSGYAICMLTKAHPMYNSKLAYIEYESLKNPRFKLVGRNYKIK